MHGQLVQADGLEGFVRLVEDGSTWGFINAAALHADQPVFHDINQADAVLAAEVVELQDNILCGHLFPVNRNGNALLEFQGHIGRNIGRIDRGDTHFQETGLFIQRLVAGVFQVQAFVAEMPEVLVLGVVRFPRDLQRDVMRFGIIDFLVPGLDIPLTPGRDNRHIRRKVLDGQFEPDLVISLTGAAVADRVCALFQRNFHEPFRNTGTRMAGTEEIILIHSAGFHRGDDIIVHVFIFQIQHVQLGRTGLQGLFLQTVEFGALAHVTGNGNDLRIVVILLQPGNDDGRIQTARIGENNLLDIRLIHENPSFMHVYARKYTPGRRDCQYVFQINN